MLNSGDGAGKDIS